LEEEPQWLIRLHENANLMRKGLAQIGYNIGESESGIIPVIVGEELTAYQLARVLHSQGIYVSPVTYPAVRKGTSRVRVSVMAVHTTDDILTALTAFEKAKTMVPGLADICAGWKSAVEYPTAPPAPTQTTSAAA
jgi:glycine C-acetyltransferase